MEKGSKPFALPPLDEDVIENKPQVAEPWRPLITHDFGDEIPELEEALINKM